MTTIAETLSGPFKELQFSNLPPDVVGKVKLAILDLIGAALNGSATDESNLLVNAIMKIDCCSDKGAAIWGRKTRASLPLAALANGTSSHARELDDWGAGLHPGAVCIPAAAAALQYKDVTGQELITAIALGYDVMMRTAKAAGGDAQYKLGWHPTGTCGSLGAAATVGKILDLNQQQITWALGLAGSFTGGTLAFMADGAMSKRFHPGKAAETGLIAAFAAMEGFTGPVYIYEAERGGFLSVYGKNTEKSNLLVDRFGSDFWIMKSGLKPYASCRDVHAAIDATLYLKRVYSISDRQVRKITVESTNEAQMLCGKRAAKTVLDAQMSIPVGVALVLIGGEDCLLEFKQEQLEDPTIVDLASRVDVLDSPKFSAMEHCAEVTIELDGGKKYSHRVDISKGDPKNPMTFDEVQNKFIQLASPIFPNDRLNLITDRVLELEKLEKSSSLFNLLSSE